MQNKKVSSGVGGDHNSHEELIANQRADMVKIEKHVAKSMQKNNLAQSLGGE